MRKPQQNVVRLRLLYDAFAPETVEAHELKWRKGATLGDYLEGLPTECEWMLFLNGQEVELADEIGTVLEREDQIGLIMLPLGGDGGLKSVLRIVLQAAAVAVAIAFPQIGWVAIAAINIGVGLVNAFLLTPKAPKQAENGDDGNSYGIDGAKNSATEGIPYPVVYGEFRTAGNFGDTYTQNVGDDQYLYLRAVLNDGLIDSVSSIELNEQPIANFKDVQSRVSLGALTAGINDWFQNSVVQVNKGVKLDTSWNTHITSSEVDQVRWDVVFTGGLVDIDNKDGRHKNRSVTFEMEVQQIDPATQEPIGSWIAAPTSPSEISADGNGNGVIDMFEIAAAVIGIKVNAQTVASASPAALPKVEYRKKGVPEWKLAGQINSASSEYTYDAANDGSVAGNTDATPQVSKMVRIDVADGDYEVRGTNGAEIVSVQTYPSSASSRVTVTDRRTRQIRRTFESARLDKGYYRARIRRTTAQSTNQYWIDEVYLADVAEIEADPVALRGTANLSLRIKLTDQLNGIPGVTSIVRGSVVQKYDIDGNPTVKEWSSNPAWIGLDILCGVERGAGYSLTRIDWPRWLEFAEHCEAKGLQFNGIFDTGTNMGDALNTVLRLGHAAPVPFGTKISVAIDRARAPVASFTQANILKGTFAVSYMPIADRANEFEITYYDKTDRNKAKTIRYVDPKAVTFNEVSRLASVSIPGIDNIEQARGELWRSVYANRLLIRSIEFDAFLDAINLNLGEVALIQHNQMEWAFSGRLKGGSTVTQLNLDQKVTFEDGASYAALVVYDALLVGTNAVHSVVGNRILVTGTAIESLSAKRVIIGDNDYEIVKVQNGGTYHTITVASDTPPVAQAGWGAQLFDTDVIVEHPVINPGAGEANFVTLASPLPSAPALYSNFVFGKVEEVRKPFALVGVSGSGIEKRKLSFIEYHEGVYAAQEVDIPIPVKVESQRVVPHVTNLLFDFSAYTNPVNSSVDVRVHWDAGRILNYAGADIYMAVNGGASRPTGTAEGLSEFSVQLSRGDTVEFSAVAFNRRGDRAPIASAPSVKGTISNTPLDVEAPGVGRWLATAVQLEQAGSQIPAIEITGACENTDATAISFYFREAANDPWMSGGSIEPTGTSTRITTVRPNTSYIVGVGYQVSGNVGAIRSLPPVTVGQTTVPWDSGVSNGGGTKPEDNATVGAPPGTSVGGVPVEDLVGAVSQATASISGIQADIDELFANGGGDGGAGESAQAAAASEAAALAAAAASSASEDNALIHRNEAQEFSETSAAQAGNSTTQRSLAESASAIAIANSLLSAAYAKTVGLTPNGNFDAQLTGWDASTNMAWANIAGSGYGTLVNSTVGQAGSIASSEFIPVNPARVYRLHADFVIHTVDQHTYAGVSCFNDAGQFLGNSYITGINPPVLAHSQVYSRTGKFTGEGGALYGIQEAFPTGTTKLKPIFFANEQAAANGYTSLKALWLEDVTESARAASSADIAENEAVVATAAAGVATSEKNLTVGFRNEAETFANASTSAAAVATDKAASATASAGLTATYRATAIDVTADTLPSDFAQGGMFWSMHYDTRSIYNFEGINEAVAGWAFPTVNGIGRVAETDFLSSEPAFANAYIGYPAHVNNAIIQRGSIKVVPGKRSRISIRARVIAGNAASLFLYGFGYGADDYTSTYTGNVATQSITPADGWVTFSGDIEHSEGIGSSGSAYLNAGVILSNVGNVPGTIVQIASLSLTDVTESNRAETQAGIASNQAVISTARAAAAQQSFVLAASVMPGTDNKNPRFANFPVGTTIPADWAVWAGEGTYERGLDDFGNPALRMSHAGANNHGVLQYVKNFSKGTYVFDVTFKLEAGDLYGMGVHAHSYSGTGATGQWLDLKFSDEPDINGVIHGAGVVGRTYRFQKTFRYTVGEPNELQLYAMNNYLGFGAGIHTASTVLWMNLSVRPAGLIGTLTATVTSQSGVLVDLQNKTAAAFFQTVAIAGESVAAVRAVAQQDGSSIVIAADKIYLGNEAVSGGFSKALSIIDGNVLLTGGLSAGTFIRLGVGVQWEVALRTQAFLKTDGETISFGAQFFSAPTYTIETTGLAPLAAGERYDLKLTGLTGSGATVYAKIITPSAPSNYNLTVDTTPGTGPQRQIDKGVNPDASTDQYNFRWVGSATGFSPFFEPTMITVNGQIEAFVKIAGVWQSVGQYTHSEQTEAQGKGNVSVGYSAQVVFSAPQGVQAFGISDVGSGTISDFGGVDWQAAGSSGGTRTACPNGEKATIRITPQ